MDQLALTPRAANTLEETPQSLVVGPASEVLSRNLQPNGVLLIVGAIGAVTRLIAPLLIGKDKDPAVIVLDAHGKHVVPLLGGHQAGAEQLAMELAAELGGHAVLTGDIVGCQGNARKCVSYLPYDIQVSECWLDHD